MIKIITKFYIIFLLITLSASEISQSINLDTSKNKVSIETLRIINNAEIIGTVDSLGVYKWLGIPYAEKPINNFRWRATRELKN